MLPHFPVSGKNTTDKLTFALGMYVPEAKFFCFSAHSRQIFGIYWIKISDMNCKFCKYMV